MKKILFITVIEILFSLFMVSCAKDPEPIIDPNKVVCYECYKTAHPDIIEDSCGTDQETHIWYYNHRPSDGWHCEEIHTNK